MIYCFHQSRIASLGTSLGIVLFSLTAASCDDGGNTSSVQDDPGNTPITAVCGDGRVSGGEVCDTAMALRCSDFKAGVSWQDGGSAACSPDCRTILQGTCIQSAESKPICGDNIKTDGEVCDKDQGIPESCSDFDSSRQWKAGGKPACKDDCSGFAQGTCVQADTAHESFCGDNTADDDEMCDGDDVPFSCLALDGNKQWESGGKPACSKGCDAITTGTCVEIAPDNICGDGRIGGLERCDGSDGVPETCELFDKTQIWKAGGKPACKTDCSRTEAGTCESLGTKKSISFFHWNVLFEFQDNNGEKYNGATSGYHYNEMDTVANRAQRLHDILASYADKPDFLGLVEMSPMWHDHFTRVPTNQDCRITYDDKGCVVLDSSKITQRSDGTFVDENGSQVYKHTNVTDLLNDLGYERAPIQMPALKTLNNDGEVQILEQRDSLMCEIIYKKDRFKSIEDGFVPLKKTDGNLVYWPKTIVYYNVLEEIGSGDIWIGMSSHWDANVLSNDTNAQQGGTAEKLPYIIRDVVDHELNRAVGAKQIADLTAQLKEQYPKAHFIFAGDLNTLDLNIIFTLAKENKLVATILGSDYPSLITHINALIPNDPKTNKPYVSLPDDFKGAFDVLIDETGFQDTRREALAAGFIDNDADHSTAVLPESFGTIAQSFSLKPIIDYTFFSKGDDFILTGYEVKQGASYEYVSDHYPVLTEYIYGGNPYHE